MPKFSGQYLDAKPGETFRGGRLVRLPLARPCGHCKGMTAWAWNPLGLPACSTECVADLLVERGDFRVVPAVEPKPPTPADAVTDCEAFFP
jgi:hypothetical protein